MMELNLATMAPKLQRMITQPLEGLTADEREAVLGLRQMYRVAAYWRDEGKRRQWGTDMIDREKAATETIRACPHWIAPSQDIETHALHFQHGDNREHVLVIELDEAGQYPTADIPVAEWITACHELRGWWHRGTP